MTSNKRARYVQQKENECTVCSDNPIGQIVGVVCDHCVLKMNAKDFNVMVKKRRYVHKDRDDEDNFYFDYKSNKGKQPPCFSDNELKRMKELRSETKEKRKFDRKTKKDIKLNRQTSMTTFFNIK